MAAGALALKRHKGAVQPPRFVWDRDEYAVNLIPQSDTVDPATTSWTGIIQGLGVAPFLVTTGYTTVEDSDGNVISMDRMTFECGGTGGGDRSRLQISSSNDFTDGPVIAGVWLATLSGTLTMNIFTGSRGSSDGLHTITTTPTFYTCSDDAHNNELGSILDIQVDGANAGAAPIDILIGGPQANMGTTLFPYIETTGSEVPRPGTRLRTRSTTAWTSSSKTNYIDGTHDFTNAEWTGAAAADYRTLTDSNAAAYQNVSQKHTVYAGEDAVVQARVSKDNVAKTTRFPILRLEFRTEAASSCDVGLDTSTGEVVLANNSNATVHGYGVIDEGRYWRIWISANDNGRGNSQIWPALFPAVGAGTLMTAADYSVTGQGTITVDGVNCTFDKVTQNSELPPMIRSDQDVPNVGYYDTNVIYMFKGAVQATKLALERRVQLVRSRTAFLLRGLTRNLIN